MRTPIVAGNWKMNKTAPEARELAAEVRRQTAATRGVEVVVCPPFTALHTVRDALRDSTIGLGAQNVHHEERGAFTGEISVPMLLDLGCRYAIIGHSERRTYFGETDEGVRRRTTAALEGGLVPIVCVGESLAERDADRTEEVVARQVRDGLGHLGADLRRVVVAYEPVWAIGTGRTATPEQAQSVHRFLRRTLGEISGEAVARTIRILYGGSVTAENARDLFACPDIDGGLIGGASLKPGSFAAIVAVAAPV